MRLIAASATKHDRADAEHLARLGRIDPALLAPVRHRGLQAQRDLAVIRARDSLVRARTSLINHVRQAVKSPGGRLPTCAAAAFTRKVPDAIPAALAPVVAPHLTVIADLSTQIVQADRAIVRLGAEVYPGTQLLRQVAGVGPLTALTFILTIGDPTASPRAGPSGPTSDWSPGSAPRANANPSSASRRPATSCCDGCWWGRRITSSARSDRIRICGAGGCATRRRAPAMPRSALSRRGRADWRSCCIASG